MSVPSGPKGTRDFYPEEMSFQQFIFSSWQKTCQRYGFEYYEAPMFEHLEIYTQKSGEEIEKQLYTFKDKAERMLALRPELTPSLARMVAAKGNALKRPVRWYSIPRLFRYEKMQKGRLREFFQLNMDILGVEDVSADAELISAVIDMMRDLGLNADDFKVRISSRTLLEELFTASGLDKSSFAELYALLDRKNKISEQQYKEDLAEIIPDQQLQNRFLAIFASDSLDQIQLNTGETPALDNLKELFKLLNYYGFSQYVTFDIGIVRGLAYYTGIVFEVFDIKKSMRAIAGGGRYDKLVELYGGPSTPAVGFAAGDVVLGDLIKEKGLQPQLSARSDVFLVAVGDSGLKELIDLAQRIRSEGFSCEFPLKISNIGKQLKAANAARSLISIFVGGQEASEGKFRCKDMLNGEEILVNTNEIISFLQKRLTKKT
ncbi:MAG TPA: histidine--tRNA ligase [Chitinispirillaceae bacterium]|nr:histidine--tRNA ligase [Chitinispirillaceae bacterium]